MSVLQLVVLVSITVLCLSFFTSYAQTCTWTVGDYTLDLSSLGYLQVPFSTWEILGEMCTDGETCDSDTAMIIQKNSNSGACTAYLAKWNANLSPEYSDDEHGTWHFAYKNGATKNCAGDANRQLNLYFICSASSADYSEADSSFEETETDSCIYNFKIYTKYACTSDPSSGSSTEESAMSAGSWMLLIGFIVLFLYCVIGYIWNVRKSQDQNWKDFRNNTPHLNFWCMVPKWTWAGCCVTKEWTQNKYQQYRSGRSGDAGLVDEDEDEEEA